MIFTYPSPYMTTIIRLFGAGLMLVLFSSPVVYAQNIRSVIHSNGTFDILGSSVKIMSGYPALDNKFLKRLHIKLSEKEGEKTNR